jgi:hypothetical protein
MDHADADAVVIIGDGDGGHQARASQTPVITASTAPATEERA